MSVEGYDKDFPAEQKYKRTVPLLAGLFVFQG